MYILNRVTGEPVFGIKETPVAQSKVPGEQTSPTQPIPVKPPPFGRMSFKMEDLVTAADTTEEHAAACRDLVEKSGGVYNEGPFTPWVYRAPGAPPTSSVIFPGAIGGANWGGIAADPKLGFYFVFTNEYASLGWIEKQKEGSLAFHYPTGKERSSAWPFYIEVPVDAEGREGAQHGRGKLAVPETTMGPAHRGECGHGRFCVADSTGRNRSIAGRQAAHGPYRYRRPYGDGWRPDFHRRHK